MEGSQPKDRNVTLMFYTRFVDIDIDVRVECIKHAKFFFQYHPELVGEITGTLK